MILVYTGNGKGKTSACLGQVLRALGCDMRVAFAQFMKKDGEAGEQVSLKKLLPGHFYAGGAGFFLNETERPLHRQAALNTLHWAMDQVPLVNVLILDESVYALNCGLLTTKETKNIILRARAENTHLILSGRDFPDELVEMVDLITEMKEKLHPWQKGQSAIRGLDF